MYEIGNSRTFNRIATGNATPAHPCARGISAPLHVIDVRGWVAPAASNTQ